MKPKNCIYPDCLKCAYSDCGYSELEYSDVVRQNKYDKELEIVEPEVQLRRKRQEKYEKTDKAKARKKRYEQSDKAKARWRRYYYKKKLQKEVITNEQSKSEEIQRTATGVN